VSGPTTAGAVAHVLPNGLAAIPQGAPPAVQRMIAAGNQIVHYPYSWGGGHAPVSMKDPPGPHADRGEQENDGPGYDCSSSVSFVLWGGGLGQEGRGQWVTIYAGTSGGEGHTFIAVAGIVLDTVDGSATTPAGSGPRWQPACGDRPVTAAADRPRHRPTRREHPPRCRQQRPGALAGWWCRARCGHGLGEPRLQRPPAATWSR
jgi:hypothetical protein